MKVYYNGKYKLIDSSGKKTVYEELEDIPDYDIKITEIEVEEGTVKIEREAFALCKKLEKITIPNSVIEIGPGAFRNCYVLESIELPKNITKIDNGLCWYCTSLKEINLPKNIIEINRNAFSHCKSLEKIIIPENTINIDDFAFDECISLKNVTFNNPNIKIYYDTFIGIESLNLKDKEKLFYQIAKSVHYENIPDFFEIYGKKYNSELIQELMTININFFNVANDIDKEVFLDAALDSINNIYKKNDDIVIKTDLCDIIKKMNYNSYDIIVKDTISDNNKFIQKYNKKINKTIENYYKKEEIDR